MGKITKHWFKHDMFASQDSKLKKLDYKYPIVGYGLFFKIIEMLYQQDGELENDIDFLAHNLNYDKEIVRTVIEDFELFAYDDNIITNDRVQEGLKEITEISKKRSKSSKLRWEAEKSKQ